MYVCVCVWEREGVCMCVCVSVFENKNMSLEITEELDLSLHCQLLLWELNYRSTGVHGYLANYAILRFHQQHLQTHDANNYTSSYMQLKPGEINRLLHDA